MSEQFAVIGLGRVGASLARTLDSLGHEVLGMDCVEEIVQDLSNEMPNVNLVSADATEDRVLRDLGLESFDGAAVVIGENIQASVLVTLTLKDLGVPRVISRANSPLHARVLERVGADHVVQPEREFGEYLARRLASPSLLDYLELGEGEALIEIQTPRKWVGKTLMDLDLHNREGLIVLAVKPEGRQRLIPDPQTKLGENDTLIVGGSTKSLDRIVAG